MKNKLVAFGAFLSASAYSFGAMTADPADGMSQIETFADTAITTAIAIGVVVIGWGYVKRLVKKG